MKKTFENHLVDGLLPEKFQMHERIGKGGSGTVYRFSTPEDKGRFYAIKRMQIENEKERQMILKEISNLDKIKSFHQKPKSISEYHGYYIHEGGDYDDCNYCLVFDDHPKTLEDLITSHIKKKNAVSFDYLHQFFREFLFGMAFLQGIKINHRDLKPKNLLIDEQNHLKIIDYGIAEDFSELDSRKSITKSTKYEIAIAGTENYMSPELLSALMDQNSQDLVEINPYKSDVFSFGLIMLELGSLRKVARKNKDLNQMKGEIKENLKNMEESYENEITEKDQKRIFQRIMTTMEKCLSLDPMDREDFVQIFKEQLTWERNNEKFLYHILLEEMELDDIRSFFSTGEKDFIEKHAKLTLEKIKKEQQILKNQEENSKLLNLKEELKAT